METTTTEATVGRRQTPTALLVLSVDAPREDWLAARRNGIAATDLVAIMGQSKYKTAYDVWCDKTMPPGEDHEAGEAAFWGTKLEEPVAHAWADKHGVKVRRVGLVHHEDMPWAMASLDRLVSGCPDGRCALEVKTRSLFVAESWERELPQDVRTQVMWQLLVTGLDHIHVAALIGGQRMVEHVVHYDHAEALQLVDAARLVWDAVNANTPPDMPAELWTADFLDQRHQKREGTVEVGPDVVELLGQYQDIIAAIAALEQRKDSLRTQLVGALGEAEAATVDGLTVYTYKTSTSRRFNSKKLQELFPEVAKDDSLWNTTTTRTLRVTTKEGK